MAKIKILKNKGTGKTLAAVGTTLLILGIAGCSLFGNSSDKRPEQTTDDDFTYSETTERRTEADIHTVAPDDEILDEVTFEDETLTEEQSSSSLITSIIEELTTEQNTEAVTRPNTPVIDQPDEIESSTEETTTAFEEPTVNDDVINDEPIITPDDSNQTASNKELSQAFADVLTKLNLKLKDFFAQYNRQGLPTLTGFENIIIDEQNGTYTFSFKAEGSVDAQILKNYKLILTNDNTSGSNFVTLSADDNIDELEFLKRLEALIEDDNSQITSFKEDKVVEISDHQKAGKFILDNQGINVSSEGIQKVSISMDLNSDNSFDSSNRVVVYTYTNNVDILLDDVSYLGKLTVTSEKRLKTETLEDCIQKILNGEIIDGVTYKFDVNKIQTTKIYDTVKKVDDMIEAEQAQEQGLTQ